MPSTYSNIAKLCTEDPISVSRMFSLKFHALYNTVIHKGKVLSEVNYFYWKKEHQARGAPHYHVLPWIHDALVIGKDEPERIRKWLQARITCHIPDPKTCPELNSLVTWFQSHIGAVHTAGEEERLVVILLPGASLVSPVKHVKVQS